MSDIWVQIYQAPLTACDNLAEPITRKFWPNSGEDEKSSPFVRSCQNKKTAHFNLEPMFSIFSQKS